MFSLSKASKERAEPRNDANPVNPVNLEVLLAPPGYLPGPCLDSCLDRNGRDPLNWKNTTPAAAQLYEPVRYGSVVVVE